MRAPLLILIPAVTAIVWAASPAYRTDAPRAVDERMPPDECVEAPAPVEPAAGDAAPTVHHATTVHGAIGALDAGVPDEPADNLFHVHLGRAPQATEAVWLEYELRGLTDHDGVPRSINHGPSIGGQRARPTADWSQQRERVRPASLREGRNSIWFHAPGEGMPGYEVRNVRFVVGQEADAHDLVITNKAVVRVQGKVHLKGFIEAAGAHVEANGQAIACHDGVFEGIVEVPEGMESAQIIALLSDGRRVGRSFTIQDAGEEEAITTAPALQMLRERVEPAAERTLRLAEAELTVPVQAVSSPLEITMFGLPRRDVPPTGQDLVNVTAQGGGFRFLPDGTTFNVPVGITLGYDPALIPEGYGPEDIRTFYFDEGARRWMALPRDTVRTDAHLVRSRTTHFTDYINGIIQVPESPETMGYTPTSIKDFKAGDVSAGITPLPPPAANNTGATTTRFPLKLPQGRQGMQPDLTIQYNSEGGNGWLGLGWNLNTPSITIETRWGVPRYSDSLETETYLLDGEMLSPVAHRTEWVARNTSGDKTFHTRVEGSFRRIKRKGNAPEDYWWEVTEKDGTRKFYGGDGSSVEENAVLRIGSSSNSAIAKWMLHKEVDRNGNTVTYTYEPINHAGTAGSPNVGRQIYPKRIRYTGREGEGDGPYLVEFDFNDTSREDKQINCRLGFKEVTANLLKRVTVKYDGATVRSYRLSYSEGAFKKTRLDSIVEYDADDTRFYGHAMEYHDDIREEGQYVPYGDSVQWGTQDDNVEAEMVFDDEPLTALGGSGSSNLGFGASVTVGPPGPASNKNWTVGGNFSHTRSSGRSLLQLSDMNGDNLPDKVFKMNGQVKFRPNLMGQGTMAFGAPEAIADGVGELHLMSSRTRSNTVGLEGNPQYFSIGVNGNWSKTLTTDYLIDRNGDGLTDFTSNGRVYFNYRTGQGGQATSLLSSATENPITQGDSLLISAIEPGEMAQMDSLNPLHDVVRTWIAPYDGLVSIASTVQLEADESNEAQQYSDQDGVYAVIQHGNETCFRVVPWGPPFVPVTHDCWATRSVQAGDKIFFRLQSIWDGAYDKVHWSPTVSYLSVEDPTIDPSALTTTHGPNMRDLYSFNAGDAFVLSGDQDLVMPLNGTIHIENEFHKPATSDSLLLAVVRFDEMGTLIDTLVRYHLGPSAQTLTTSDSLQVDSTQLLRFRLTSPTNVDWGAIQWFPKVYYSAADGYGAEQLLHPQTGEPLMVFHPAPYLSMFNKVVGHMYLSSVKRIPRPVIATSSGQITVSPILNYGDVGDIDGEITLSVKTPGHLVGRRTVRYANGAFSNMGNVSVDVEEGDTLFVEYHVSDDRMFYDSLSVWIDAGSPDGVDVSGFDDAFGVWTRFDSTERSFGELHRNWGAFAYNYKAVEGQDLDSLDLIHGSILDIPYNQVAQGDVEGLGPDDLDAFDDPTRRPFIYMWSDMKRRSWLGYDDLTYVRGDSVSSSRMGEDDMDFSFGSLPDPTAAQAPIKASKSETYGATAGISPGFVGGTLSGSMGSSRSVLDVLDINGDRYPDVVGRNEIQSTLPTGGMEGWTRGYTEGPVRSNTSVVGVAASGSIALPKPTASQGGGALKLPGGKATNSLGQSGDAQGTAKTMIGLSGSANASTSTDECQFSWLDMNGDGLPDKVKRDSVWLNTGYGFLEGEDWAVDEVQYGYAFDTGLGGGISLYNGSIQAGLALSITTSNSKVSIMDLTGDGLPEIIEADTLGGGNIRVQVNRGNGFEPPIPWSPVAMLDASVSKGQSMNAAFTFCINLFLVRICINPNANYGRGASKSFTQFTDMDGDSYPDFLSSSEENDLTVYPSTIRRTNLLKSVSSPFGAGWKVDYEVAGNTYDLPQSKWVMTDLRMWDGFAGDGPDTSRTTFAYADGKYSRRERETYGFGEVRTHEWDTETSDDEPYRTTVQTYDVSGYYTKGLPLVKTVQDGQANKYTETENTYTLKLLNGNDAPDTYNATNDFGTAFPALLRTQDRFHEGLPDAGITRTVAFAYDTIGNVTQYTDSGHVGQDDVVVADITYHDHPIVKSTPSGIVVRVEGEERRRRSQDLNDVGNVVRIEQRIDDNANARYDLAYYENGNLNSIQRPANHNGERMKYDYTYDPDVETYVTGVHDSYGHSSSNTYEYKFGQLTGTTDMNGQETRYTVDHRGRVTSVTGPYEDSTGAPYTIKLAYFENADVPYSVVTHFDPEHPDGPGIRTVTFLDGLFRPLQVKKSAVIREENGNEAEKWIVSGRVKFDAFGRTVASRYPVTSTAAIGQFVHEEDDVAPTTTTFDVLDRPLLETLPDGAETHTEYSIETANGNGAAFRTRVTDALTNKKDSYTDVREREILRTDHGPNGAINTTFRYNGIGELLTVADNDGNETSYTYDQLGRKLTYDHPDGGLTAFTYDPAGNLLTKNTANLRELFPDGGPVKYTYDHQRLVRIDYPRNYQNQVVYTYGDSTETEFNRVGRVKLQLDASGGQEFFYGPLGEVERTIRTIVVSQNDIRTFVSEERYDTWNRIQEMRYPDGEVVSYAYNTAGKLKQVSSEKSGFGYEVVSDIGYDKFEQRVYLKHGNNVETRYAYEPDRRRLSTLKVDQPDGTRIMDNVYGYDAVNNILSLRNERSVPPDGQGGPMSSTYGYDNLYRLTQAEGSYTGSARQDHYTLTMVYDDLHNITNKRQTHSSTFPTATLSNYDNAYAYEGGRPHTPSRVGHTTYTWDANGNLADREEDAPGMGNRQLAWDEENRLQALTDEGYVSQYTYDAAGERVLKSHGGMQGVFINGAPVGLINHRDNYTIYVSPYLVHAQHGFTKHYFIEGQRVASRTGTGQFLQGPLTPPGITAGRVNFRERILAMQQGATQQAVQNAPVPGIPTMPNYNGQPEISGNPYYMGDIGTYAAPETGSGWPMPPTPPGAPGTPPTTPTPSVTNETVQAGYAFQNQTNQPEYNRYFFHPDHLGSASYITGMAGTARQHLEYMAFGETFMEEHNAADPLDYLFNGKELDRITGLYYYGARYYDPVVSIWASVDPMAEKYSGWSPYNYTLQNPVVLNDPDGKLPQMVVGALIGGGMDLAIQAIQVHRGKQGGIKWGSVAASAATGALGVGLAAKAKYFLRPDVAKAATMAIDASMEVMKQAITKEPGGEINWKDVGLSVVMGATVGSGIDNAASSGAKGIMFDKARKQAIESDAAALGSIASGIGSAALSPLLQAPTNKKDVPLPPSAPSTKYGSYGTGGRSDMRVSHELNE